MGLGRRETKVRLDFRRYILVALILGRRRNQPRILVEHEAAGDVLAEIVGVLLGEDERLFEQLIGVERALELEEQIRAEPLGFEISRGELRASADVARELGVVLPGKRRLSDADEVFPLAVEMRGPTVRVLDREELRPLPEADLLLIAEEVGGGIDHGVREVEVHVGPARGRDAVHEALLEIVHFRQGYPKDQQEDREEQGDPLPARAILTFFVPNRFDDDHPQQDRVARA